MSEQVIQYPEWATPLYQKDSEYRYFVFYGGRGGAKSYSMAYAALMRGIDSRERIVGLRETMRSIDQSIHALFKQIIEEEGLQWHYQVLETEIRGANGTEIFYSGLRKSSSSSIKSLAGVSIALLDEGEAVSESSMKVFLPTIREKGSQIWMAFNPKYKTDAIYERFVLNTPPKTYLKKVNLDENPFVTDELKAERDHDKRARPWDYAHVWEGELLAASSDSTYARQMVDALDDERIGYFPIDRAAPVHCAWDIGGTSDTSDATAIWFFQVIQGAIVVVDYMEETGKATFEITAELRKKGYDYGTQFLPHDARAHHPTSLKSCEDYVRLGEIGETIVLTVADKKAGIENVRSNFHRVYLNKEPCELGIEALNGYTGKHDHFSHGADAFRYLMQAVTSQLTRAPKARPTMPQRTIGSVVKMARPSGF